MPIPPSCSYPDAVRRMRSNPHSVWSAQSNKSQECQHASSRIYEGFAQIASTQKFRFSSQQKFFCVGSCFSRELEEAVTAKGYEAQTRTKSLRLIENHPDLFKCPSNVLGRPTEMLNRYNAQSMALLMEDIAADTLGDRLLFGADTRADFHYTNFLQPLAYDLALKRRKLIRSMYREAVDESDIFVFTLGLCEAFEEGGNFLNVTPSPRFAAKRDLKFHFLSVEENTAALRRIVSALRAMRPNAEVIFTVSPVPLDVTFTEMDIVVANSLAKANLLVSAHAIAGEVEGCYYFPSFEIVDNSSQELAWHWDRKHVQSQMAKHVMINFIDTHLSE